MTPVPRHLLSESIYLLNSVTDVFIMRDTGSLPWQKSSTDDLSKGL
jgi:hypothetical protein